MVRIRIGRTTIKAEIAETTLQLAKGLMLRRKLAPNSGLLLKFPRPGNHYIHTCFMRFPLEVIFIRENGTVARIKRARPWALPFGPGEPVRYALEVNAGFCVKNRIRVGTKATMEF